MEKRSPQSDEMFTRSRAFTALLSNSAQIPGRFAYTDGGYCVEVLGGPSAPKRTPAKRRGP